MPWCDTCDRLVDEGELDHGECPTCGADLAEQPATRHVGWRFRILVVATAIYLTWRCVQGVQWLTHHA